MTNITFAYRNNPGHEAIIPDLTARLRADGHTVDAIAFPAGTDPAEIRARMAAYDLGDRLVVPDGTVQESADIEGRTLDRLYADATENAIAEAYGVASAPDFPPYEDNMVLDPDLQIRWLEEACNGLRAYGEAATALHREVLRESAPDAIYIVEENLTDHPPFDKAYGRDLGFRKVETALSNPDPFFVRVVNSTRKREGKDELPLDRKPADWIASWITDAGYDPEKIHTVGTVDDLPAEIGNSWIVADSHKHLEKDPGIKPRLFQYPLVYGIRNLVEEGHLSGSIGMEKIGADVYEALAPKL